MAHISGIELPREKRIVIGLTYIYGIGKSTAERILAKVGIDVNIKVKDLSVEQEKNLREVILDDYVVEGDLRTQKAMDIQRLMEINCYRGIRHKQNLPVRGQRTHTNARTRKGRKR
ncbi:MAG: 30S ribosomal protein S13 [Candidatus Tenebribacter davisii]|nr:30S ribosomal protein S13 [Candidatus Tenebribacter davisii]